MNSSQYAEWLKGLAVDRDAAAPTNVRNPVVPVFCLPDFIEKFPVSILICFLWVFGSAVLMAFAFYYYYRKKLRKFFAEVIQEDGLVDDQQDSKKGHNDTRQLRRMLPIRPDTRRSSVEKEEVPLFNGPQ